jgi:hypothetical protein
MARFADGCPNPKRQHRAILANGQVGNVEYLHRLTRSPDLDRQPDIVVKPNLFVDLGKD